MLLYACHCANRNTLYIQYFAMASRRQCPLMHSHQKEPTALCHVINRFVFKNRNHLQVKHLFPKYWHIWSDALLVSPLTTETFHKRWIDFHQFHTIYFWWPSTNRCICRNRWIRFRPGQHADPAQSFVTYYNMVGVAVAMVISTMHEKSCIDSHNARKFE